MVKEIKIAEANDDDEHRCQVLINTFHMVRTAAALMHPIAPEGTEMILEYLNLDIAEPDEFWSWDRIFDPLYSFMKNPEGHKHRFLEPRIDFFKKHSSQIKDY